MKIWVEVRKGKKGENEGKGKFRVGDRAAGAGRA